MPQLITLTNSSKVILVSRILDPTIRRVKEMQLLFQNYSASPSWFVDINEQQA